MALTKVSPSLFQVSNNITSVTVGGSANTISLTFDSNGVITGASNNAVSVANTQITGTLTGSQISSNTVANTNIQTGAIENYMRSANLDFGMRNRIINGAMVIDQRNVGANTTVDSTKYTVDRWRAETGGATGGGIFVAQRSTVAPAGFTNSLSCTVTTTDTSLGTGDLSEISQIIEGFNIADLGWGTASARPITLSFWVRSSVTESYSIGFQNDGNNRSYVAVYTVNAANTWEQKIITVPGDTSGTWLTNNGIGLQIRWCFATGSNRVAGSANAWSSSNSIAVSGTTNPLMGTNGATFYITGVQLEEGSQATSFEYRQFTTELALCQRYFYKLGGTGVNTRLGVGHYEDSTAVRGAIPFPVTMRAIPTATASGNGRFYTTAGRTYTIGLDADSVQMGSWTGTTTTSGTAGHAGFIDTSGFTSSFIQFSAEL
jgi:hypothetical protein